MRRALSISLIFLFWLPALVALVPGSEDLRLPYCCRRQGVHHCAMDEAQPGVSSPAVKASSRCPAFPSALPATIAPAFVHAAPSMPLPAIRSAIISRVARREAARAARLRAQVDRGPPLSATA